MPMFKIPGRPRVRRTVLLLLFIASAVAGWAQPVDPFSPENPVVMGRGGSFTAKATGYNSFFANPAGFAGDGELTLASVNVWAFMNRELVTIAQEIAGGQLSFGRSATPRSTDPDAYESCRTTSPSSGSGPNPRTRRRWRRSSTRPPGRAASSGRRATISPTSSPRPAPMT